MFSSYLVFAFYARFVICVDIEITGDLTFDVKIRDYRQRGVDVDIPLRLSIGDGGAEQKKRPRGVHGRIPRVVEDEITSSSRATPASSPVSAADKDDITNDTSLEENNKLLVREMEELNNGSASAADGAGEGAGEGEQKIQSKRPKKKQKTRTTSTTELAPAECPYRYPAPWEANTVLSNMMNKLTKLFVMMSRSLYEGVRPRSSAEAARLRRFKVISARSHDSFDRIFANMSTEFKLNYNASRERLMRADEADGGEDKCARQAAVGRAWRQLLEQAQDTYRAAALRCVDLHLDPWLASRDGSMKTHLNSALSSVNKQLLKDVERIRSEQLRVLCKLYQLC